LIKGIFDHSFPVISHVLCALNFFPNSSAFLMSNVAIPFPLALSAVMRVLIETTPGSYVPSIIPINFLFLTALNLNFFSFHSILFPK
jgi:hypothetical protein